MRIYLKVEVDNVKKQTTQGSSREMKAGVTQQCRQVEKAHFSAASETGNLIKSEVRTAMGEVFRGSNQKTTRFARTGFPAVLAGLFILCMIVPGIASADTAGPNNPSTGANNTSIGTKTWSSTSNIVSSNNSDASANLSRNQISNYLVATGFGFAIPADATINGITVSIERADGNRSSSVYIRDNSIMIVKGGSVTGTNHANTTANWPTTDTSAVYGSTTDLWGATWSPADINASNFGVALSAIGYASSSTSTETAYVDNIRITVTYTLGAACTANAATVTLTPASQTITTNGGSVTYTATVTNNDSGAGCSSVTYSLTASDSNTTSFNPSTLGSSSVTLAAGATSSAITLTVSAASGQTSGTNTTTVTASAAGHTNGSSTVSTTLSVAPSCTAATPTLQIAPASQSIAPSGTASYTVTVTNNDSAGCSATTFSLGASDSNSADFTTPSTLTPASLSLSPGQSATSTLSAVAKATATNAAMNITTVQASAAGHASPANVSVTTTVSATSSSPTTSLLHNSVSTGSAKWSTDGGWGVAGGKYGAFNCETCHAKDAANIKRVKRAITVSDTSKGNIPGGSAVFNRVSGTAAPYTAGQGVLGDDTSCSNPAYTDQASCTANGGSWNPRSQSDRICEVCHSATSYHRYNTAADPDGTGPLAAQTSFNHNNATDCIGCHPHNRGFKGAGDCYGCHLADQNATRRAVVNDSTGGDFRKASHHVTDGTTNQIANKDVCMVCHGDVLTDKGHPGVHPTDPEVDLKDPDTGAYVTADEAGTEQVCANCHDANGATRPGLPAGATAAQPFNLTSMTVKDTSTPPNIGWTAGQQAHSYNATNSAGGCLACHGNAAAAGTTLDPKKNAHGSDQSKMMQFAYSPTIAAYPAADAGNFCYNCHGTPAANGAASDIKTQFAKTRKHTSTKCTDCHSQHQAKAGNHAAQANTAGGVLNGVSGAELTTTPDFWAAPSAGNFTAKAIASGTDVEATLCFKCHSANSGTYNTTSPSGGYSMTDVAREFNPNNVGNYKNTGTASWQSGETAGSFHPVLAAATNNLGVTNNIVAPWTKNSLMTCSDCHASDTTTDPNGPHGSAANFILKGPNTIWNETIATTSSGMPAGTFCINCHNQSFTSSRFSQHASRSDHRVACSKCHVMIPHGSEHPGLLHSAAGRGSGVPAPTVVNSAPYMRATTGNRLYIASYPTSSTSGWGQSNCGCNGTGH